MMDEGQVCFVDVETVGLHPDRHPIWEVGLILDGVERSWQLAVSKVDLERAEPVALDLNRFHERHHPESVTPAGLLCDELSHLTRGRHLVGAIPSFDEERLRRLMQRHGVLPRWSHHLIDVEALAIGFLAARGVEVPVPWSSSWLTEQLGVAMPAGDERHTALGDARWAREMWLAVLGG